MSEFKGTPGKWDIAKGTDEYICSEAKWIATTMGVRNTDEAKANARLIAACPEMYLIVARRAGCGDKDALDLMEKINGSA